MQAVCLVCSVFVRKACIHAGFRAFFVYGPILGPIGPIPRSAAAARGGVRQLSRSAARTRKSPVFARLSPFSNARPNARTPSVKRERPEALETRRRRKKTPEQRRAAVVIDTERARRRRGVGSNFRRFSELTAPRNPLISLPFSAYPTFSRPVPRSPSFLTLISLRHN